MKGKDPIGRGGSQWKFRKEKAIGFPFFLRKGFPKTNRIKFFHHKPFVVPGKKENVLRMFAFELEQEMNVFFRLISPIHIVPEENNSIGFFKIAPGHFAGSLQVTMGVSDKDNLSLRTEMDQAGLLFQYPLNLPEQSLFGHSYPSDFEISKKSRNLRGAYSSFSELSF
jgi:hypothetical protein